LLISIPLQLFLVVSVGAVLFLFSAVCVLFLMLPLVMLLSVSPPIRLEQGGLRLYPLFGKAQFVKWEQIQTVREYPLLPKADQEIEWRLLQGRKKYRAAAGKMLIVTGLPWRYRVAGFFAGAQSQPIIALTNRTHTDYEQLLRTIEKHVPTH
jgi:hypothetical protein